jgi:hypothetical protein
MARGQVPGLWGLEKSSTGSVNTLKRKNEPIARDTIGMLKRCFLSSTQISLRSTTMGYPWIHFYRYGKKPEETHRALPPAILRYFLFSRTRFGSILRISSGCCSRSSQIPEIPSKSAASCNWTSWRRTTGTLSRRRSCSRHRSALSIQPPEHPCW